MLSLVLRQNVFGEIGFLGNVKEKMKMRMVNRKLAKSKGIDKLLITLFLAAFGLGLCIYFKNQVYPIFTLTISQMSSTTKDLTSGNPASGSTGN